MSSVEELDCHTLTGIIIHQKKNQNLCRDYKFQQSRFQNHISFRWVLSLRLCFVRFNFHFAKYFVQHGLEGAIVDLIDRVPEQFGLKRP